MSDGRTPAQIEADIVRRRQELAVTLDEIGARVHPRTIADSATASMRQAVDRTAGRAYIAVNRAVTDARGALFAADGTLRRERIVPVAVAGVVLIAVFAGLSARRRRM